MRHLIGTCTDEQFVEQLFGSVSEFARQVELHGDNFFYGSFNQQVEVVYDEASDVHSFYQS